MKKLKLFKLKLKIYMKWHLLSKLRNKNDNIN